MRFLIMYLIMLLLFDPMFIVPRHTLIDVISKEVVPFKAAFLNKRSVSFYADITTQDNDIIGRDLHVQILNLAKKRPKKGIHKSIHV